MYLKNKTREFVFIGIHSKRDLDYRWAIFCMFYFVTAFALVAGVNWVRWVFTGLIGCILGRFLWVNLMTIYPIIIGAPPAIFLHGFWIGSCFALVLCFLPPANAYFTGKNQSNQSSPPAPPPPPAPQ